MGNVSSVRLKGSAEQKLANLKTRMAPIKRVGTKRMPLLQCGNSGNENLCQTDVCDVNIFHSLNKFIELYIFYIFTDLYIHGPDFQIPDQGSESCQLNSWFLTHSHQVEMYHF